MIKDLYMKNIILGVLNSFASLSPQDFYSFNFIVPGTDLILRIIDDLQKVSTDNILSNLEPEELQKLNALEQGLLSTVEKFTSVFTLLVNELKEEQTHVRILQIFSAFAKIMVKIQRFSSEKKKEELPPWFYQIINCIRSENQHISIIAIESFIEILISESIDPIYCSLKSLIITETKLKSVKFKDYTKSTIFKLWTLLDFHYYQNKIIELILPFQSLFPNFFAEVVSEAFATPSIAEKELNIRRFATFWRITGESFKSFSTSCNAAGLFVMLDFLEHENPLIRHTSKNWLLDSKYLLYRILDPIFDLLLQPSSIWYKTENGQFFYTKVYETRITNEAFRKLKSIVNISTDFVLAYVSRMKVSERIMEKKVIFKL